MFTHPLHMCTLTHITCNNLASYAFVATQHQCLIHSLAFLLNAYFITHLHHLRLLPAVLPINPIIPHLAHQPIYTGLPATLCSLTHTTYCCLHRHPLIHPRIHCLTDSLLISSLSHTTSVYWHCSTILTLIHPYIDSMFAHSHQLPVSSVPARPGTSHQTNLMRSLTQDATDMPLWPYQHHCHSLTQICQPCITRELCRC